MGGDKIVEFITIIIFEILIWKGILGPWLNLWQVFGHFSGKIYLKSFISIFSTNSLLYSYAFNSFLEKKGYILKPTHFLILMSDSTKISQLETESICQISICVSNWVQLQSIRRLPLIAFTSKKHFSINGLT